MHEEKLKQKTSVTVERAENGFMITCYHGEGETTKYIYPTIEKVAKELPGLFSVSEAEAPEEDEESLEKLKTKINSKKY